MVRAVTNAAVHHGLVALSLRSMFGEREQAAGEAGRGRATFILAVGGLAFRISDQHLGEIYLPLASQKSTRKYWKLPEFG
jgi:hypothetical protein